MFYKQINYKIDNFDLILPVVTVCTCKIEKKIEQFEIFWIADKYFNIIKKIWNSW